MTQKLASLLIPLWVLCNVKPFIRGVNGLQTMVQVLSPASLFLPSGFIHQAADYGFGFAKCPFDYQTKTCQLIANLMYSEYVNNLLCEDDNGMVNLVNTTPSIILVERGDCSFATQTRRAQTLGAAGLLIADHTCLCQVGELCSSDYSCAPNPPLLIDDGSGGDIAIPSILLQKQDADAIKGFIQQQQPVQVKLTWQVSPSLADIATIDIWHPTFPHGNGETELPSVWEIALAHLASSVVVTPKFYILAGNEIGCDPVSNLARDLAVCLERCIHNGRYCAPDPVATTGVTGAHILEEMVRRMCIWQGFGRNQTDSIGRQYWRYITAFSESCAHHQVSWTDDACSWTAMNDAGIDYHQVSQCVVQAGGSTADLPNPILEASLADRQGIAGLNPPSVVLVNGVQYQSRTFSETFAAICGSYNASSLPEICGLCVNCADESRCVAAGGSCLPQDPVMFPTIAPPVLPPPTPGIQDTLATGPPNATLPTLEPSGGSSGESENNSTIVDPNAEMPPAQDTKEDEEADDDSGGIGNLSDNTKVVIVVAVVGGAILVIFVFVIFLVIKLLKRIRKLEKQEYETPTTTSPAGSNIWDLPQYVGKEDPFNSECEPIPQELLEEMAMTPVANERANESCATDVGIVVPTRQSSTSSSTPTAEPNRGVLVTDVESQLAPPDKGVIMTEQAEATAMAHVPALDRNGHGNTDCNNADKSKRIGKTEATSPGHRHAKTRRSSKPDPTLMDIMGKAAPEPKFPKKKAYGGEEKEEIVEDEIFDD